MKYAAIDIGSNAVRLLIGDVLETNDGLKIKKYSLTRVPIRLGADTFNKGEISEYNVMRLAKAMKSFKLITDLYDVNKMKVVATSALREAGNAKQVVKDVFDLSDIKIEMIDGKKEAAIISKNISRLFEGRKNYFVHIDVGGGSTEVSLIHEGDKVFGKSFKLGTVRMLKGKDTKKEWGELDTYLKEIKSRTRGNELFGIGTGGNINKLLKLSLENLQDRCMTVKELERLTKELKECTYEERMQKFELKEDRADVIIPASSIYLHILNTVKAPLIYVPKVGLADGLVLEMFQEEKTID